MTKVSIELLRTGFKQDTVTCDISKNSNFEEDLQTTASKYEVISGPYFPAFGLNMERYEISLRIQSQCGKIRTRNYSVFVHFSRSISPYSVRMRENTDQKLLRIWTLFTQ